VLETRLRKPLHEKLSGTYNVGVQPTYRKIPTAEFRVSIDLGTDPARMDEMTRPPPRPISAPGATSRSRCIPRNSRRLS
jgi:hypothetical protein